jgi:RNA polymerase sigma factor (sigma-70 family)
VRRRWGADPRSVERIYDDLAPAVLGYFRSHRMADPEGLTGDVFVAVTHRLAGFEGDDAAVRRWVFTIAHHRRVDEIRRSTREVPAPIPSAAAVEHEDPFDPDLIAALSTLTDGQRQVVVLRHVADLSVEDVAAITGRSVGSVKMLSSRGLEALAARLSATVT